MNLSELRTFLAIVETGSLVRASEKLHVTQSTVTARLKTLEQELGQSLIHRHKSGASLTAAGTRLLRYAETISGLWQQARQETALPGAFDAVCNMACHPDLWPGLGAQLFDWISAEQPSVALSIWQGGASDIGGWLSAGLSDLALSYVPIASSGQNVRPLCTDLLCLVSTDPQSPPNPDLSYVFVEAGDEFGRWHAETYADSSSARLNFGSALLGLDHILRHGGSAYLPKRIAAPHLAAHQLYPVPDAPDYQRQSYVIINKSVEQAWDWLDHALAAVTPP